MGYESKVIVVDRQQYKDWVYGDEILRFDLSKMGYEEVMGRTFKGVFRNEIDFDLYYTGVRDEDGVASRREDMYGEVCKWATLDEVIFWLENSETGKEYRRAKTLLGVLRGLKAEEGEWEQVCVVHFGY